ncbi:hypothetical protein DFP73DRAFT_632345 [Morchella snyderi]|nr:hypothetical protein DFP73DRAFT_632345 [Morchella snyderi]
MPPTTQPQKQPPNAETIVISFLCGSLVLSFLLAAVTAVLKVYTRPQVVSFIKRTLARMRRTPPTPVQEELPEVRQSEVQQREVQLQRREAQPREMQPREGQLVDVPFDFGLREDVESGIAYPPPVVYN